MGCKVTKPQNEAMMEDDSIVPSEQLDIEDANDAVQFAMKKGTAFKTFIELSVSCQNLPKLDFLSQTDAKVVCYIEEGGVFSRHGSTEVIRDNPNPIFENKIRVPYNFEKPQTLKFEIYDVDEFKEQDLLDKQELIGHVITTLHQIVCSANQTISLEIIGNQTKKNRARKCGFLIVSGKEIDESNNKMSFHVTLESYTKTKNELKLVVINNEEKRVFHPPDLRSTNKKGTDWNLTIIPTTTRTLDHDNSKVKLRVLHKIKNNWAVLGETDVFISDVKNNGAIRYKIRKNGFDVGEIKIKELKRPTRFTFLNYVDAGAEISLIIAMDFTNSNKVPTDPKSLHYCLNDQDNEYLQALKSIGGILQYYDSDNRIPLYGFGAKLPPYFNTVSNCFSLNGNYFDPEVYGLDEVIKTYKEALFKYKFHGPTIFSDLLKMASEYAKAEVEQGHNQKYFILLILTDGEISDFDIAKDEIVKASTLPMSIIIIGIGDSDKFQKMLALDGDDNLIESTTGEKAMRDIVQFVPFSKYKGDAQQLANKTLEEVPKQFLQYMTAHKIEPNKTPKKMRLTEKGSMTENDKNSLFNRPKQIPSFLIKEKERFIQDLLKLEIDQKVINKILEEGVPAPNINLVVEMVSHQQDRLINRMQMTAGLPSIEVDLLKEKMAIQNIAASLKKNAKVKVKQFKTKEDEHHGFENLRPKEDTYKITHMILNNKGDESPQKEVTKESSTPKLELYEKVKMSFLSDREMVKSPSPDTHVKKGIFNMKKVVVTGFDDPTDHFKELTRDNTPLSLGENVCLNCSYRQIDTVLMPCGHAAFCENCLASNKMKSCNICKQKIVYYTVTHN